MWSKFFKHAGFTVAAAVVPLAVAAFQDPTVTAFLTAHPVLLAFTPIISGALGALAKYVNDLADQTK